MMSAIRRGLMRIVETLFAALLVVAGATGCASSEANHKLQKDALVKSVTIPVDGMACDSCAARIKKSIAGIDGVIAATVSFDDKQAVVQYDARKLEPNRLVAAIGGLGFKAGAPVEGSP